MSNGGKALQAGDHHIILAERTVDDEHVSAFISATYDSHMLIIGIEHQIAGLGLIPRDGGTVGVLHVGTAAAITARSARPAACAACLAVTRAAFAAF